MAGMNLPRTNRLVWMKLKAILNVSKKTGCGHLPSCAVARGHSSLVRTFGSCVTSSISSGGSRAGAGRRSINFQKKYVEQQSFLFHPADPRGITDREVYQEFQPSYDILRRWCQGLFRSQVPCTPSLHCPIANSASTQSQQPV